MRDGSHSGIWLSDLMQLDDDVDDDEIYIDWNDFLQSVKGCIRRTAVDRCISSITDIEGRDNLLDRDCQPSSPAISA